MERKSRHVPERTCIVCRTKKSKHELYRLAVINGEVVWDKYKKFSGRGAYVCKNLDCIVGLTRMKNFLRVFRRNKVRLGKDTTDQMLTSIQSQ